jgi:transposase
VEAKDAMGSLCAGWRFHQPKAQRVDVPHYQGRGRPKNGQPPKRIDFRVEGQIVERSGAIVEAKRTKGKFVLATNELDPESISDETILAAYKCQSVSVERGFRFLKDPLFFASSLFLRIMALLMVMGLALLVYALAEHWVRTELKKREITIENQVGKPTQRPTLRRIFQVFEGIDLLLIHLDNQTQRFVLNLKPIHYQILSLFGDEVEKYYRIPDG